MATKIIEMSSPRYGSGKGSTRTIIPLKAALTHQNCAGLAAAYADAAANNKTEIILDCQGLTFLDSEAMELLIRMHEELKEKSGALKLIGLNDVCRDILIATRLMNILNVYKDIHGAIRKWP